MVFYLVFQVFPIEHLQIFTEEELERLLCGERDSWAVCILSLNFSLCTWGTDYFY
jgi:hypothetical protein